MPEEGADGVEPLADVTSLARSLAGGPSKVPSLLDVRWRLGGSPGPPGIAYRAGHATGPEPG
jgi:hypothetical protein